MVTRKKSWTLAAVLCTCTMLFTPEVLGQPLQVSVSVSPSTLNLGSEGQSITCTVWLPDPYVGADVSSVSLEGVSAYSITGGGSSVTCKFDRSSFEAMLAPSAPGEVELTLSGTFSDGTDFEGTDTITVKFADIVVDASAGPNGSISPAGATTVTYGSDLTFTASPGTGYQVDTWSVDGEVVQTGGTGYTLTDIQVAHTVNVTFKLLQYTITATSGPGGSVSPASATVDYDGSQGFS
ncbi:MAG: InlB B-repeat-containing protein, partial [Planctomycetota bacterium]